MPVKLGFIILSLIGVLRIPEEFYLYKDKDMRDITRSMDDGLFTFRCHWNVTNCSGIWINNIRIILQCIWGGFILIQYNCGKLWNSGIIRTATKQKSKQREFRFVNMVTFSIDSRCLLQIGDESPDIYVYVLSYPHKLIYCYCVSIIIVICMVVVYQS